MSFLFVKKDFSPVFDIPGNGIYKKEFVDRRIPTVAAKPLLSEKNQPTRPSTEYKFRKCFAISNNCLYKTLPKEEEKLVKKFKIISISTKDTSYYYPIYAFYTYRKITQKKSKYTVYLNILHKLPLINTIVKESLYFSKSRNCSLDYNCNFKVEKKVLFSEDKCPFCLLLSNQILTKDLLSFDVNINSSIDKIENYESNVTKEENPYYENYLNEAFLYDFSKYLDKYMDNFECVGLHKKLLVHDNTTKLKSLFEVDNLSLYHDSRDNFGYYFKAIKEELYTSEYFGKFYIPTSIKFNPIIENVLIKNKQKFSLDFCVLTTDKNFKYFSFELLSNQFYIFTLKKAVYDVVDILKIDSLRNLNIKEKSNKKDFIIKKYGLRENNLSFIPLKYKRPRLALKLKIPKPKLDIKSFEFSTMVEKKSESILGTLVNKIIRAKFYNIEFDHKSLESLDIFYDKDILKIDSKYKLRKNTLFNKCPNHASYTVKAVKKILFKASFKKSLKQKFQKDDFIPIKNKFKSLFYSDFKHTFKLLREDKISYIGNFTIGIINTNKIELKDVIFPKKFAVLKYYKSLPEIFTYRKRIGLNHIKRLKLITFVGFHQKNTFNEAYVSPQKRIQYLRKKEAIFKSEFKLGRPKFWKEKYIHNNYSLKTLTYKYQRGNYDYGQYLPKQICDSFELKLDIINIKSVSIIQQKHIIPPPGWLKIIKKQNIGVRLGPFPFGFPEFRFPDPIYISLISKACFTLRDKLVANIIKQSSFIFSKTRLYLPELSMKMPRRLLYTDITPKNSPKEFYISKVLPLININVQPRKEYYFDYYWLNDLNNKAKANSFRDLFINKNSKIKDYCFKNTDNKFSLLSFTKKITQKLLKLKMESIDRFYIIKANKEVKQFNGKVKANNSLTIVNYDFSILKAVLLKNKYHNKIFKLNISMVLKDLTLPQEFPLRYSAKEIIPAYRTRFRTFRFPYIPEMKNNINEEKFFIKNLENENIGNCKFQDDFRITKQDFETTDVEIIEKRIEESSISLKKIKRLSIQNFNINYEELEFKPIVQNIVEQSGIECQSIEIYTPEYYQHIITPRFFMIKELFSYKYKRRGKILTTFKYLPMDKLQNESFSDQEFEYVSPMDYPSFYWVILLRKNYIFKLTSNNYINSNLFKDSKVLGKSYRLKAFENEKYDFDRNKSLLMEQVFREEYFIKNSDANVSNTSEYYNCFYTISNNTNIRGIKTYDILKELSKKSYKVRSFSFYLQLPILNNEKLIDKEDKIQIPAKKERSYPKFNISRERSMLDIEVKNRASLDYKPLFIPEFIDIQSLKTRKKIYICFDREY